MPNFRYRALTQEGEMVSGSISAATSSEVTRRIEYLGLVPIDAVTEETVASAGRLDFLAIFRRPTVEDVTIFTRDLALLMRAGARINDALELLATDLDIGRLRPFIARIRAGVLSGESFGDAIGQHPTLFPAMYVALVRVGEASGTLDHILEVLANERLRSEALRRKLADALRYPAFVLFAASCVLVFFLLFVLPQFATVLKDFGAKLDPVVVVFMNISDVLRAHGDVIGTAVVVLILAGWYVLRRPAVRGRLVSLAGRLPVIRPALTAHRTAFRRAAPVPASGRRPPPGRSPPSCR
jgi:general secretion pathway protein F